MYSAEKESTFPESKTDEEKRNYAGTKDTHIHIYQEKLKRL